MLLGHSAHRVCPPLAAATPQRLSQLRKPTSHRSGTLRRSSTHVSMVITAGLSCRNLWKTAVWRLITTSIHHTVLQARDGISRSKQWPSSLSQTPWSRKWAKWSSSLRWEYSKKSDASGLQLIPSSFCGTTQGREAVGLLSFDSYLRHFLTCSPEQP